METSTSEQRSVSDAQEASMADYHALNPWPYVVLALGLLSSSGLISPLFAPFGVAAIVFGIWASMQEEEWTTDWARIANGAGIALALFFLSILLSRQVTRNWSVKAEADEFSQGWFELLRQGDIEQAHQLSLAPQDRQVQGADLKKFYLESGEAKQGRDHFYLTPPLNFLVRDIKEGTIRLDQDIAHERNLDGEYIDRQYSLVVEKGGVKQVLPFRMVLRRTLHPKLKTGRWQVYSLTEPQVRAF